MIIWITGLSGAGKTTIASATVELLRARTPAVFLLDGDVVRRVIQDPNTGHDPKSRLVNAYRISRMAQQLELQGIHVVVSTMSLFHEIHEWNRENFQNYFEVLIDADSSVLETRRHLYKAAQRGEVSHVVGVDIPIEFPKNPDLIVNNTDHTEDFGPKALQIIDAASRKFLDLQGV